MDQETQDWIMEWVNQAPTIDKEQTRALGQQELKFHMDDSLGSNMPGGSILQGIAQAGSSAKALGARAVDLVAGTDMATPMIQNQQDQQAAMAAADPGFLSTAGRSISQSAALAVPAGLVGGAPGAIGVIAGDVINQEYTKAQDKGRSDLAALGHAALQGSIEAGIMLAGGQVAKKLGLADVDSLRSVMAARSASNTQTLAKELMKLAGSAAIEGGEEAVTEALAGAASVGTGVEEKLPTLGQIGTAAGIGALAGGTIGQVETLGPRLQMLFDKLDPEVELSDNPTRREIREAGIDEPTNWEERRRLADQSKLLQRIRNTNLLDEVKHQLNDPETKDLIQAGLRRIVDEETATLNTFDRVGDTQEVDIIGETQRRLQEFDARGPSAQRNQDFMDLVRSQEIPGEGPQLPDVFNIDPVPPEIAQDAPGDVLDIIKGSRVQNALEAVRSKIRRSKDPYEYMAAVREIADRGDVSLLENTKELTEGKEMERQAWWQKLTTIDDSIPAEGPDAPIRDIGPYLQEGPELREGPDMPKDLDDLIMMKEEDAKLSAPRPQGFINLSGLIPTVGDFMDRQLGINTKKFQNKLDYVLEHGGKRDTLRTIREASIGKMKSHQQQVIFNQRALAKKMKKQGWGPKRASSTIMRALKDPQFRDNLPTEIKAEVETIRAHMDGLSRELKKSGLIPKQLAEKIGENEGQYITRSYRIFSDSKYIDNIDPVVYENAANYVKQNMEWSDGSAFTDVEAANYIDNFLEKIADKGNAGILSMAKLQKQRPTLFKKRGDLAKPIRELLGEETDPERAYIDTISKLTKMVEAGKALNQVYKIGKDNGWIYDHPTQPKLLQFKGQEYGALDGKWAQHDIYQDIKDYMDSISKQESPFVELAYKAMTFPKAAATVLSVSSAMRNLASATVLMQAQGLNVVKVVKALGQAGKVAGTGIADKANITVESQREKFLEAIEYGVIDSNVDIGVIENTAAKLADMAQQVGDWSWKKPGQWPTKIMKLASEIYQSPDSLMKYVQWTVEQDTYREAFPDASDAEIKSITAEIVKQVQPTYARLPKAIQGIRRGKWIAPFIAFTSEIARTFINTHRLAEREISSGNPVLVKRGWMRRVIHGATAGFFFHGMQAVSMWLADVDWQEDEDRRLSDAPWNENQLKWYSGDGETAYSLGFVDPWKDVHAAANALIRSGEPGQTGPWGFVKEAGSSLLQPELFLGQMVEAWTGNKTSGGRVWNDGDTESEKLGKMAWHMAKIYNPGTVKQGIRSYKAYTGHIEDSGRSYDPWGETTAWAGWRPATVNIKQAFVFQSRKYADRIRKANAIFTKAIGTRGTRSAEEVRAAREQAEKQRQRHFSHLSQVIQANMRLGMSRAEIESDLKSAGIENADILPLIAGRYRPYQPSERTLQRVRNAPNPFKRRQAVYEALYRRN